MVGNANANGVPFIKNGTSFLKDNIVLWYDIKKQGATNENMANNPILKDLSGNGHDATCYNFAWSKMSGIGKYVQVNFDNTYIIQKNATWKSLFNINQYVPQEFQMEVICKNPPVKTLNIIGAWREGEEVFSEIITTIKINEVQTIPILEFNPKYTSVHVSCFPLIGYEVTIKQIPEYPNALVLDGVDDYCRVDGLPILTDYTVITKRKYINTDADKPHCFASKSTVLGRGAFIIDEHSAYKNFAIYSFGRANFRTLAEDEIIYITPTSYNGEFISKGNGEDDDILWIGQLRDIDNRRFTGALYSFVLFNRTLTEDEIKKWIRINIDKDYLLPSEVN